MRGLKIERNVRMRNATFAVEGIVTVKSTSNGVTVFSLDPVLPYRLDMTQCGGKLALLLVRQNLCWRKVLPDNSVDILDASMTFEYVGMGLVTGSRRRVLVDGAELLRYMAMPSNSVSSIKVAQLF